MIFDLGYGRRLRPVSHRCNSDIEDHWHKKLIATRPREKSIWSIVDEQNTFRELRLCRLICNGSL